jgi:hypothetical protein
LSLFLIKLLISVKANLIVLLLVQDVLTSASHPSTFDNVLVIYEIVVVVSSPLNAFTVLAASIAASSAAVAAVCAVVAAVSAVVAAVSAAVAAADAAFAVCTAPVAVPCASSAAVFAPSAIPCAISAISFALSAVVFAVLAVAIIASTSGNLKYLSSTLFKCPATS